MSTARRPYGPWQGLWLVLGYIIAQASGYILLSAYTRGLAPALRALLHEHRLVHSELSVQQQAWLALFGFLASATWSIWYVRRYAGSVLRRGDSAGIGWRAARPQGYLAAAGVALLAVAFAAVVVALLPPDPDKLTGPTVRMLDTPGLPQQVITALALVGAPLMEEFVFRGAFFAALAGRWGATNAGIVTTLLFMALHVQDKIHWWPGFAVVGFLGALLVLLRLRYRSIWPGMLAHFLYNASFFFLP
ncbi:MAG TPA: CPBP family intramembrane glutamic endopeptidase [Gammaproteobacteria bacterium]|nr:CPBP family intramembrane glutamic endopeptidase [Gammaproteobacteria bacterium]